MNRLLKLTYCLTGILFSCYTGAQNEQKKWYFGQYAGLDFMTSPPTPITNTTMIAFEGCASIADAAGNLLFYTDGATVWNQQQQVMANGGGLLGNNSSEQSSLIVKQPGNSNIYFLFTLDAQGMSNGLKYSVINMNLNSGLGSVTTQNVSLYTPSMEQLTGVRHCNGTDIWVISHQFNTNSFVAYLVSATGVSSVPVISSVGNVLSALGQGMIKISPNGKKLGMSYYNGSPSTLSLFDFDNSTGIVSNSLSLLSNQGNPYSCEFSPDGTKFYSSVAGSLFPLYQWDLCAGSSIAILNSQTGLGTSVVLGLQNGPDGKIYCSRSTAQVLGVINNPNLAGSACNYVNGQSVGSGTLFAGLPNFICSAFKQINPFTYTVNPIISCSTASFSAPPASTVNVGCANANSPVTSYLWNFGEPVSGTANTSTLFNPVHNYASPGSYTVKLIQYSTCSSDTTKQTIIIAPTPTISVSGNFSICPGQTTTLTATGANLYTWNSSTTAPTVSLSPANAATYSVVGTNTTSNCRSTATITVTVLAAPALSVSGNFSVCSGQSTTLTATGANIYTWNSTTIAPTITIWSTNATFSVVGTNTVNNCQSSKTVTIISVANPTLLVTGDFSICAGAQTTLTSSGANSYTWSNSIQSASIIVAPIVTTAYTVTGTNNNNCNGAKAVSVNVSDCVGIEQFTIQNGQTRIFPNPFGDKLSVELSGRSSVQIYNQLGEMVYSGILQKGKTELDLSRLNEGTFFAKIITEQNTRTIRLVKTE